MRREIYRFGFAMAFWLLSAVLCSAQQEMASLIKEKGQHLIIGNDTVFTDWTDGYIEASGYATAGPDAKESSLKRARALMRSHLLDIMIWPDITIGTLMQASSVVNQGIEELIYKSRVATGKTGANGFKTTIRLDLYKWSDDYAPLAGTIVKYTQTSGSASGGGADDSEGAGSGTGAADMPDRQDDAGDPAVTSAKGQEGVINGEAAEAKRILTQTEKYFTPVLFPDYYSMSGNMAGRFTDLYPSSDDFIPHFYMADESLQLLLGSYKEADLLKARVNSDKKYKLDAAGESKYYSWKGLKEKAVFFGKYIILYY